MVVLVGLVVVALLEGEGGIVYENGDLGVWGGLSRGCFVAAGYVCLPWYN